MRKYLSFFVIVLFTFTLQAQDFSKARKRTEKLFRKELKNKDVHNAFLSVYSPSKNIDWSFAGGTFTDGEEITQQHPFYSASIGKTFTATAIAILHEQGKLDFSDEICAYLPDSIINGLHVLDGEDYSRKITIAQLLQHTSGIPDYFEGKTIDSSPNGMALLFSDTAKFWHPMEMINLAKHKMKPNFAPGTDYHYTDSEYILLGLIVENMSGMKLHNFFRHHIFLPFEMNHTYMHLRSEPIAESKKMAELFAADFEVSQINSLSLDWAGGGLATTAEDLNKFQFALHTNKILKAETLQHMQLWTAESKGMYYGYGLRQVAFKELFPTLPKLQAIGHTGSTSSFMFYCPELDVYLSGTLNQVEEVKKSVMIPVKVFIYIQKEAKR